MLKRYQLVSWILICRVHGFFTQITNITKFLSNLTFEWLLNHPTVEELHKNGLISCSDPSLHLASLNFNLLPTQNKNLLHFYFYFLMVGLKKLIERRQRGQNSDSLFCQVHIAVVKILRFSYYLPQKRE